MTIRPIQQRRMSAIWITACAYGPWALGIAGVILFAMGASA